MAKRSCKIGIQKLLLLYGLIVMPISSIMTNVDFFDIDIRNIWQKEWGKVRERKKEKERMRQRGM